MVGLKYIIAKAHVVQDSLGTKLRCVVVYMIGGKNVETYFWGAMSLKAQTGKKAVQYTNALSE